MDEKPENNAEEFEDIPLKGIRKIIAVRMAESKSTVPHFYLVTEMDMEKMIELRKSLNGRDEDVKISFNDMFIKLTAHTLKEHPMVMSHYMGENVRRYKNVHIGFAVAIEDGLLVPVIRDCDKKSIKEISEESKVLAEKARIKRLRHHEMRGGIFTITNLGMFGIENFSAVINTPESAILAIGSTIKKPVVVDDKIEIRPRMKVTLSCDHRVVDGAVGASFLQSLKENFENPGSII